MTRDEARRALSVLVEKYIECGTSRQRLLARITNPNLVEVPVRGVLHEIREAGGRVLPEDEDLVSELVYYFG